MMRKVLPRVALAVVGLAFLLSFVVVRAASFHHVDALLGMGTIRLNWILELSGIGVLAYSARRAEQAIRPPRG